MTRRTERRSGDQNAEASDVDAQFSFRFTIFEVSAVIKAGRLIVHQGMKTSVVELGQIRYIYAQDLRERELSELTIASEHQGKLKRVRVYADYGSSGFNALRDHLIALNPISDISALPMRVAYKKMGSQNVPWIAIPSVMAIGTLFIALFTSPLLIHGLDTGHETIDLTALYAEADAHHSIEALRGALTSRHVTVSGWIDIAHAWNSSENAGASLFNRPPISERAQAQADPDHKVLVPIYPETTQTSATQPEARAVITATGDLALELLKDPSAKHTGTLRDILWEGIGWRARQGLEASGVTLSEGVLMIELGMTRSDDLSVYFIMTGLLSLMTWLVFIYLRPPKLASGKSIISERLKVDHSQE